MKSAILLVYRFCQIGEKQKILQKIMISDFYPDMPDELVEAIREIVGRHIDDHFGNGKFISKKLN